MRQYQLLTRTNHDLCQLASLVLITTSLCLGCAGKDSSSATATPSEAEQEQRAEAMRPAPVAAAHASESANPTAADRRATPDEQVRASTNDRRPTASSEQATGQSAETQPRREMESQVPVLKAIAAGDNVVIVLSRDNSVTLSAGTKFRAYGDVYVTRQLFSAIANDGLVSDKSDRLITKQPAGNFAFTIRVERESGGANLGLPKGTPLVPEPAQSVGSRFVRAYVLGDLNDATRVPTSSMSAGTPRSPGRLPDSPGNRSSKGDTISLKESKTTIEREQVPTIDVADLVRDLKDVDPGVRRDACSKLVRMGPKGRLAVPALTEALNDDVDKVRTAAAGALGGMGPAAKAAVPAIIDQFAKGKLIYADIEYDGTIGSYVGEVPAAERSRRAQFFGLGPRSAIVVLWDIGGLEAVCGLIKHDDPKARRAGLDAVSRMASPEKIAEIAVTCVTDDDRNVRSESLDLLNQVTSHQDVTLTATAIAALIQVLEHSDSKGEWNDAKATAAYVVSRVGPSARAAVPSLTRMLSSSDSSARRAAISGLAGIGEDSSAAVPKLAELLKNNDFELRCTIFSALGQIGPGAGTAVPSILEVVNPNKVVTTNEISCAVEALGRIGPDAEAAIPWLLSQLREAADDRWNQKITQALGGIGKASVPSLIGLLEHKDKQLAGNAQAALGKVGRDALPGLVKVLKEPGDVPVVAGTLTAIEMIAEPRPAEIVPHLNLLVSLLDSPHYEIRLKALRVLSLLGGEARPAMKRIAELKTDPESKHVREAATALYEALRRAE